MGQGLLGIAWHHGDASNGSCPCGVSHTTPLEAHSPEVIGHTSLPPPWSSQSQEWVGTLELGRGPLGGWEKTGPCFFCLARPTLPPCLHPFSLYFLTLQMSRTQTHLSL